MARNYANVVTAIWKDPDFRALSAAAQRMYFLLLTQPNISAAGSLPLTLRRWKSFALDTTIGDVEQALDELHAAEYVIVDWDSEELLVRSFVRHDNGYGNRKRRPVILRAAEAIESPLLRRALAMEMFRLGLPTEGCRVPDALSDRASGTAVGGGSPPPTVPVDNAPEAVAGATPKEIGQSGTNQVFTQVDSLSGSPSDAPLDGTCRSDGVVVSKSEWVLPTTHNPLPPTPNPPAAGALALDGNPETRKAEGEGEPTDPEQTLIAEVLAIRPEWSPTSIRRVLADPDVQTRPWDVIAAALLLVAKDRASNAPGRLRADGPWWTQASSAHRTSAAHLEAPPNERHAFVDNGDGTCADCQLIEANRRHWRVVAGGESA